MYRYARRNGLVDYNVIKSDENPPARHQVFSEADELNMKKYILYKIYLFAYNIFERWDVNLQG